MLEPSPVFRLIAQIESRPKESYFHLLRSLFINISLHCVELSLSGLPIHKY